MACVQAVALLDRTQPADFLRGQAESALADIRSARDRRSASRLARDMADTLGGVLLAYAVGRMSRRRGHDAYALHE
jgi:hypothetical protein